jgi:hypothetical protein
VIVVETVLEAEIEIVIGGERGIVIAEAETESGVMRKSVIGIWKVLEIMIPAVAGGSVDSLRGR